MTTPPDFRTFHRHWTCSVILGWVQFNDHILETGLFKRMRALEKPQEKSYRPPRALKLDRLFPTMKFELVPMLYFRDTIFTFSTIETEI